ncbi:hypothetical protein CC80DRAFT_598520 [Byssothecium circinans]|uniref:Kinesin light chain n=1 Tax=Byssothecium circinans TaxID=147558 RepID=A0A6A5TCG3_9PLEO|nr:hypothetical protein CC80DRAFT_598520 [Byssothecium circinans]
MANLASTYGNQGRWKEAEKLEVQVMETRKRVLGEEHPFTLAPPNFELGADKAPANPPNAIRMKNGVIDKEAQRLKKVEGFWENKLLDRQKKKPGPNASQEIKDKYKTAEATLKSLYDVALKKRLLYGKERVLKDNPKDQSLIAEIDELREQLKALEAGDKKEDGKKEDNTLVHPSSPDITVSEPNGKTRAPTGLDAVPSKDGIRNRK